MGFACFWGAAATNSRNARFQMGPRPCLGAAFCWPASGRTARTDALNLTNIWDNVVTSNNQSFWASPANRLQNAEGPWGSKTFFYSGVDGKTLPATDSRDRGGAEGDRTPDLVIANDALSQLSYGPMGQSFRSRALA